MAGMDIRELRKRREMTQSAVACEAGISQEYVSQLERGEKIPSLKTAQRIARVLNVTTDQLWPLSANGSDHAQN